jgi:hypothetical protein
MELEGSETSNHSRLVVENYRPVIELERTLGARKTCAGQDFKAQSGWNPAISNLDLEYGDKTGFRDL